MTAASCAERSVAASSVATALRWLGAVAVLGSGLSYLLDGLVLATDGLRHWMPPLAMLLFAAGSVASAHWLKDAKSARLLLALGLMLVSAQFAQLGGMLLELTAPATAALVSSEGLLAEFRSATPGWIELGAIAAISLFGSAALVLVALRTFTSTLARPVGGIFLLSNLLLVVPVRESFPGLVILGALAGLFVTAEQGWLRRSARLATSEGRSIFVLLALPLLIALVRFGFYVDSGNGVALLLGTGALLMAYAGRVWAQGSAQGGALETVSMLLAGSAWSLFSATNFSFIEDTFDGVLWLSIWSLPILIYWLERGERAGLVAPFAQAGQALAGLFSAVLVAFVVLADYQPALMLWALLVSGLLLLWSVVRAAHGLRALALLLLVAVVACGGLRLLTEQILDLWLVGGLLGFGLVLGAGAVERRSSARAT